MFSVEHASSTGPAVMEGECSIRYSIGKVIVGKVPRFDIGQQASCLVACIAKEAVDFPINP